MIELSSTNVDAALERVTTAVAMWNDLEVKWGLAPKLPLWHKTPKSLELLQSMQQQLLGIKTLIHKFEGITRTEEPGFIPFGHVLAYLIFWGALTPEQALDMDPNFHWYSFHSSSTRNAKEPDL